MSHGGFPFLLFLTFSFPSGSNEVHALPLVAFKKPGLNSRLSNRREKRPGKPAQSSNRPSSEGGGGPSTKRPFYSPTVSSAEGAAVWLGSGGQMMRPCSSNFMPSERPILVRISLISLRDLRPKFLVLSISFSLFCTSSRIVWIFAFLRQL